MTINKQNSEIANLYKKIFLDLKNDEITEGIYLEVIKNENYNILFAFQQGQPMKSSEPEPKIVLIAKETFFAFSFQFGHLRFRLSYLNPIYKCERINRCL